MADPSGCRDQEVFRHTLTDVASGIKTTLTVDKVPQCPGRRT